MRWTALTCLLLAGCELLLPDPVVQRNDDPIDVEDPVDCEEVAWYEDNDRDGFGVAERVVWACEAPAGTSTEIGDCDDADPTIRPGTDELCDGIDQDCDGAIDEDALDPTEFFSDVDGDGYGSASLGLSCDAPAKAATRAGDCDDANAEIHPGATEPVCSLVDLDCDGKAGRAAVQGGSAYDTIQQAIDAAPDRARILVCPGSRVESLTIDKGIRLLGTTSDPADTRITAPSGERVLSGTGGSVSLTGLTLAGRSVAQVPDGGIVHLQSNVLEIEDCRFVNGRASDSGGAIWWRGQTSSRGTGASLTMERVVVVNNEAATHGGGLYLEPGPSGGVRFDRVSFRTNVAGSYGGAVYVQEVAGSAVTWNTSHAIGNQAAVGGALFTLSTGAGSATTVLASSSTDEVGGAFVSGRRLVLDEVDIHGASGGPAARAPRITAVDVSIEDATSFALDAEEITVESSTLIRNNVGVRATEDLRFTDVDLGTGSSANRSDVRFGTRTFDFSGVVDARCSGSGCVEL